MHHSDLIALPLFSLALVLASPALAQDHTGHTGHDMAAAKETEEAEPEAEPAPFTADAMPMDHGAMDHLEMDHSTMGHGAMDHGEMDSATMNHGQMDHSAMGHDMTPPANSAPPPRALSGPEHAADAIFGSAAMQPSRDSIRRDNGGMKTATFMIDRAEARVGDGADLYLWDLQGWYGGDIDKLWWKSEGEGAFNGDVESAEVQALWSHAIGAWFDVQAGVRYDIQPDERAHAVLGVQGLAPYLFEIDAAAFLSDKGDLTARVEAEYDQRITQRLILQPRMELSLSAQDIPERDLASGLTSIEAGVRLRYEFAREFAPYIGIGYEAKIGDTADYARAAGEDTDRLALLIGLRAWF